MIDIHTYIHIHSRGQVIHIYIYRKRKTLPGHTGPRGESHNPECAHCNGQLCSLVHVFVFVVVYQSLRCVGRCVCGGGVSTISQQQERSLLLHQELSPPPNTLCQQCIYMAIHERLARVHITTTITTTNRESPIADFALLLYIHTYIYQKSAAQACVIWWCIIYRPEEE